MLSDMPEMLQETIDLVQCQQRPSTVSKET